ncbi:hypothetical protein M378DRAFT_179653 [Amanita muscaria Koide BX008]|uniref:Uncharacterized protein n=1 Tax=Amanita muscaria (strain Koide BX008) TaxID=946122 RepID=A0A0C2T7K2_AMAMK|nr:hypothetical protein M378DRAFT_179653 [Amanita muscaria Koide BX008]
MRLLTVTSLFLFLLRTTRALPLPVHELSSEPERDLPGRYSPAGLIGREIHNADFNNAGGPPQTVNSGSSAQDPNTASQPQHPSPGTQAKPGSPQQDNQAQPDSPPNVKTARSESEVRNPKFYARKHHTIKNGDRRHSVEARTLAADRQEVVPKHGHGNHAASSHHHSATISSRKVTHQDPDSGDEKQTTPPPPTTSSSNISELPMMMGIKGPSIPGRYENSGASSNGINNDGDEKPIRPLFKGIKVNKAVADNGAPNSPLFGATLDPHQAV